jgi:serine/threonine-protein kinase RsbW
MNDSARITIESHIPEIRRAADFLEGFLARHPVSERVAGELHVILDEVLSNIIRHGYDDGAVHEIGLTLVSVPGALRMEFDDDGRPFDPAAAAPPARGKGKRLEDLEPGGLGLVFLKAFADAVAYQREGARNRLTITRRVPAAAAEQPAKGDLALAETRERDIYTLELQGRLDSTTAWALKDRLLAMVEDGARHLIVDASRTGYIGSAGFWALLLVDRELKARGGALALCGLSRECARALELGGFAPMLAVFEGPAQALASARRA